MITNAIVAGIKADLDNITFNSNLLVFLMGNTVIGDSEFRFYGFDPNSSATADGDFVIRPSMYASTNGRLIRKNLDQYYNDLRFKSISYTPSALEIATALGFSPVQSVFGRGGIVAAANGDYTTSQVTEAANLYFTNSRARNAITASGEISFNQSTGVITKTKRTETYSGTTNASGNYTVSFGTAYSVAPNIQANIINGTDTQNIRITAISTTGFTVLVRNRTDALGLLPSYSNVNGASVDVLINEK